MQILLNTSHFGFTGGGSSQSFGVQVIGVPIGTHWPTFGLEHLPTGHLAQLNLGPQLDLHSWFDKHACRTATTSDNDHRAHNI